MNEWTITLHEGAIITMHTIEMGGFISSMILLMMASFLSKDSARREGLLFFAVIINLLMWGYLIVAKG